jgi:hypothetical protein
MFRTKMLSLALRIDVCRSRNWLGYIGVPQGRWSLRPEGGVRGTAFSP